MDWEPDEIDGDVAVWPAFVDLLAATALVLVAFLAVVLVAVEAGRGGEIVTQKQALEEALRNSELGFGSVYDLETSDILLVQINLREDKTFPRGAYAWESLHSDARRSLLSIGEALRDSLIDQAYREIRVVGHSDQDPYPDSVPYSNWELSGSRAAVVARFLVEDVGLDPCRIRAIGLGPYYPKVRPEGPGTLLTDQEKERNRRIELQFIPAASANGNTTDMTGSCYPAGDGAGAPGGNPMPATREEGPDLYPHRP
jgi:outer membrane protein OmpA-like peptidoglycan-associated protein